MADLISQLTLLLSRAASHLDGVTDDYFSRDPVSDVLGILEQLLEEAVG